MNTLGWALVFVFVIAVSYGLLCLAVRNHLPVELAATGSAITHLCNKGEVGGLGTDCVFDKGRCPCVPYREQYERAYQRELLLRSLTMQKDDASACIGCLQEGEQIDEEGHAYRPCEHCSNQRAKSRMELSLESLGGVMI